MMAGTEEPRSVPEADFFSQPRFRVGGCARIGYSSERSRRSDPADGPRYLGSACGRGSAGRASPCQGEGRGFESRRPLGGAACVGCRPSQGGITAAPKLAPTAEWPSGLGKGLQSPVHGFDSRLRLHVFDDLRSSSRPCYLPGGRPPVPPNAGFAREGGGGSTAPATAFIVTAATTISSLQATVLGLLLGEGDVGYFAVEVGDVAGVAVLLVVVLVGPVAAEEAGADVERDCKLNGVNPDKQEAP
jgi:hypothetical protein